MNASVLVCGAAFDGFSGELAGRTEIAVRDGVIVEIGPSVGRPDGARVIDLSERTVCPGFIDTHVHLTMDGSDIGRQTLDSSATKALKGLAIAREYLGYGFTTLRDLGSMDPEFPTVDLRNALDAGLAEGPRLIVAGHVISSTAGHGDMSGFYPPRWDLPVSAVADGTAQIRALVRREHAYGGDWIKTANAGGYFSVGDDPARTTWLDDEMDAVCSTARLLGMPVAVHTGGADACKQAIRAGARSLEHAYLIDEEGIEMARRDGVYVVPTMQMTKEDLAALHDGTLPEQAVWKFRRDSEHILNSQRLLAGSDIKIAFGTDCGMFPFSHGIREFSAMVDAGLTPLRALQAATSTAAEMLGRDDLGRLEPGARADIVAMPGNPLEDITVTSAVDFVMADGVVHRWPEGSDASAA
ncbi:amidohydrolase family protein [Couchioplanes caeruleus]|uniref:metal-dependent hydrolase family protein n=1 Tax=Couchioplanes caeruleus TaxID=56438 RepID=UPI0020BDFB31|nr:amidohydrolase family protein [Couchioplanes caeruleus]UQU62414.1 amidohydrolase family protein [Couchioplanes caeruleus]